jgi:hypothetical protein
MPILAGTPKVIMSVSPAVVSWLAAKAPTNEFAASLNSWFLRKGELSEKQVAAVERIIARDAQRQTDAPVVNIKEIEDRFEYAKLKGVGRPLLRLGSFKFKPASAASANYGAIYVTAESDGRYLGKIKGGQLFTSRECSPEEEAEIIRVAADPAEAAKAYAIRTGNCCVCGRLLTAEESVNKMIGPICATRYGF